MPIRYAVEHAEDLLEQANPVDAEAEDAGTDGEAKLKLDPSLLEAIREAMGPEADEVAGERAEGDDGGTASDEAGDAPPDDADEPPLAGAGRT